MSDLIERQAAIEVLDACDYMCDVNIENGETLLFEHSVREELSRLPSAQQEIIYCKECSRHSNGYCHHPETYGMYVDANHFCGYAERMGDE